MFDQVLKSGYKYTFGDLMLVRSYYMLTKPGIILGNLVTTAGAFAFAAGMHHFPLPLFLATLVGLGLIIASACVFNNYMDRHSDAKMARTKHRAFVQGTVSTKVAIALAILMGLAGVVVLSICTNTVAVFLSLLGFAFYVGMYTVLKHRLTSGTLIGSIAGAIPPVVGYCAVTHQIDLGAVLLFITLFLWQMPHFYSIALFRLKEYETAKIPVHPIRHGARATKLHIVWYIIAFMGSLSLFTVFGLTGRIYLVLMLLVSSMWLAQALHGIWRGFWTESDGRWARKLFVCSLVVIMTFSTLIALAQFRI